MGARAGRKAREGGTVCILMADSHCRVSQVFQG